MRQKIVEINNKRIILSERIAEDYLALIEFVKKHENKKNNISFVTQVAASAVSDSIKSSRKNLPIWNLWKRLAYQSYTSKKLLKILSPTELFLIQDVVVELEDNNKKKVGLEDPQSLESNVSS